MVKQFFCQELQCIAINESDYLPSNWIPILPTQIILITLNQIDLGHKNNSSDDQIVEHIGWHINDIGKDSLNSYGTVQCNLTYHITRPSNQVTKSYSSSYITPTLPHIPKHHILKDLDDIIRLEDSTSQPLKSSPLLINIHKQFDENSIKKSGIWEKSAGAKRKIAVRM